jgi:hypothetical protein
MVSTVTKLARVDWPALGEPSHGRPYICVVGLTDCAIGMGRAEEQVYYGDGDAGGASRPEA